MSDKAKPRDQDKQASEPKKKGSGMKRLLIVAVVLLAAGGGVGGTLFASGMLAPGHAGPDHPRLVAREGVSGDRVAAATVQAQQGQVDAQVFKATYFQLPNNFTSNLRGGQAFVQIGMGVSTYYDERVIEHLRTHEMAVRSAILMVLSEQDPTQIASTEGKEALRTALRNAVNSVLTNKEGFGGIHEVFFTSFVTQ